MNKKNRLMQEVREDYEDNLQMLQNVMEQLQMKKIRDRDLAAEITEMEALLEECRKGHQCSDD